MAFTRSISLCLESMISRCVRLIFRGQYAVTRPDVETGPIYPEMAAALRVLLRMTALTTKPPVYRSKHLVACFDRIGGRIRDQPKMLASWGPARSIMSQLPL